MRPSGLNATALTSFGFEPRADVLAALHVNGLGTELTAREEDRTIGAQRHGIDIPVAHVGRAEGLACGEVPRLPAPVVRRDQDRSAFTIEAEGTAWLLESNGGADGTTARRVPEPGAACASFEDRRARFRLR